MRKSKKRKMERLVGLGEDSSHQGEHDQLFNNMRSTDNLPDDWRADTQLARGGKHALTGGTARRRDSSVMDHAQDMIEIVPQRRKRKAPKERFKFKKKGKITKKEEEELRRSNFNIKSMFKQQADPRPVKQIEEREEEEEMEVVDREREELLERVRWKKKEWETRSVCRAVLVEMVFKAVDNSEERHCYDMVSKIVDIAWIEIQASRIVTEIWAGDDTIRKEVERRLKDRREEEEAIRMMIVEEDERRRRLERVQLLEGLWQRRMEAVKMRKVLRMLRELTLEELEMEVEESLVLEMMDMDVEPEVVGMETESANGLEMVTMELEKEIDDSNQELYLTTMEIEQTVLAANTPLLLEYRGEATRSWN